MHTLHEHRPLEADSFDALPHDLARLLLTPPQDTVESVQALPVVGVRERLIDRAYDVYHRLGTVIMERLAAMHPDPAYIRNAGTQYLDASRRWTTQDVRHAGMYMDTDWAEDVAAATIEGRPVEFGTVLPMPTFATRFDVHTEEFKKGLDAFGNIGMAVRRISDAVGPTTRLVIDINDAAVGRNQMKGDNHNMVSRVGRALYAKGVVRTGDVPGYDFVTAQAQNNTARVDQLVTRLAASGNGKVVYHYYNDGRYAVNFEPAQWVQSLAGNPRSLLIPLVNTQGAVSEAAVRAASYLDDVNKYYRHISIEQRPYYDMQGDIFGLLRALGITSREKFHTIEYERTSRNRVPMVLARVLRAELAHIIQRLENYVPYGTMKVGEYVRGNYGGKSIQAEDEISMGLEMQHRDLIAECLGVDLNDPATLLGDHDILHPGVGPNLFPVILSHIFTNGRIDGREYSAAGRQYMQRLIQGTLTPEQMGMWAKFEDFYVSHPHGGELYRGSVEQAKSKLDVAEGDIFTLPPKKYRMVHMDFVAESVVPRRELFWEAMRSVAGTLTDDKSVLVARFMKRSDGWAGHEAVPISEKEVLQACEDNGLEVLVLQDVSQGLAPEQRIRPERPEEGMLFLVARPRTSSVLLTHAPDNAPSGQAASG